jgi:hyperosmotically inducible protein
MRRRKEPAMKPTATIAVAAFACAFALAGCGEDKSSSLPPPPQPAPQAQPAAPQAAPAPAPSAAPAQSEAPKPDPDAALASAVKAALEAEKDLNAQGIDVTARDGSVTLWGTVPQAERRALAVKTARGVPGVKSVQDNLQVVRGS